MAKTTDAPTKPTPEEQLAAREARLEAEKEKIALARKRMEAKLQREANLQTELKLERSALEEVLGEWEATQDAADIIRADLRHHERNVRRLEYALRLRGMHAPAPAGQPPTEEPATPQDEASGDGGATGEEEVPR